jgi:hypothetical protein
VLARRGLLAVLVLVAACIPTVDESNRPCPCAAGWQCCNAICIPEADACRPPPDPRFAALAPGEALDLGPFACEEIAGETRGACKRITDDAALRYDARNHRLWLSGRGGTSNDALFFFDLSTARWSAAYAATECSARTSANHSDALGAWLSGSAGPFPRPVASPGKDMVVFVPELNELVVLARGEVFADGCSTTQVDAEVGRVAHWNVDAGAWRFTDAGVDAMPDYGAAFESWEYDERSRLIIGVGQAGLYTYDPFAGIKRRVATDLDPTNNGFSNALVATDDGGLLYFDFARAGVYRVELDRSALFQSRITRITSTGGYPTLPQPAFAWDGRRRRVGGAVEAGVMWFFDPASATFSTETIGDGGVGTMQMHCLDYDPVDDVFVFVTTLEGGYRTWAYRPAAQP